MPDSSEANSGMSKDNCKIFLIVVSGLAGMALPGAGGAALMSPMMAAAPGALEDPATVLLLITVITFPITLILGVAIAWILFARQNYNWAWRVSLLPTLNLGLGAIALTWIAISNHIAQ